MEIVIVKNIRNIMNIVTIVFRNIMNIIIMYSCDEDVMEVDKRWSSLPKFVLGFISTISGALVVLPVSDPEIGMVC